MDERKKKEKVIITEEKNYKAAAFFPMIVFLVLYLGSGIVFTILKVEDPFKQVSREVSLVIGVAVALLMGKRSFSVKTERFAEASGSPGVMLMCLIFILAGAFSGVTKGMGAVDSTVNLGLSFVPSRFLVAGLFLVSAAVATAMGTCMGTVAAIAPVAVGLAEAAGLNLGITMSAVVGGGMFGDNLSIISDTTIASTRGAGCAMKDKFRMNFKIALPAAILTFIVYSIIGGGSVPIAETYTYNLIKVIPYVVVLILAISGMDVILVLMAGTILSGFIGFVTGSMTFITFCQAATTGIMGMLTLVLIAILMKGIVSMVQDMGGLAWLSSLADRNVRSRRSAQYFMGGFISIIDFCLGNNTVCIIVTAPLVKPLAKKYSIAPQRLASILDVFACIVPGISPIGTVPLMAMAYAGMDSPFSIIKYSVYPLFLLTAMLITIQFDLLKTKEEKEGVSFYPELEEE